MPRKKNQSQNVSHAVKNSTENMSQNSDVELKWRDTTLRELQSMFSGSVDLEVVQLVLSESDYNVNDAIEKLFVLSGIDQGQEEHKNPGVSDHSTLLLTSDTPGDSELSRGRNPSYQTDSKVSSSKAGSSFAKASEYPLTSSVLYNTAGAQNKAKVPRTMPPSFALPFNTTYNTGSQVEADSESHTVMTSGLPDFPDNVSQQFKALQRQAEVSGRVEKLPPQEASKQRERLYNPTGRAALSQQLPDSFHFGHEPKGNFQSSLKQTISQNASSEEWKKVPHNNREQKHLDHELTEKKMQSINEGAKAIRTSKNKEQGPSKQRTSNSDSLANSQTYLSSNPPQNVKETSPNHGSHKPQFRPTVNNTRPFPNHGICNNSPRDSIVQPPAVQRQFPPFMPAQRYGQVIPGSALQPRAGFIPGVPSPWQQGLQRPMPRGQIPHQYPQGTFPYQPPFFFGRAAHPATVLRPSRPASGVGIPFIPTIHQKLLILIRGLPGSGKSTLAQKLKGAQGVVLSTDDFFYRNQRYEFDTLFLGEAHEWNQKRAKSALENLISPVIIDNTNTQCWEMKPYVSMGLRHGYYIKFIEPDTTWKWNVKELARRNRHGVGIDTITRMKERYEQNVSIEKIMNCERKVDLNKTGNDSDPSKGGNRNPSPTPQRSSQKRRSEDLGKREKGSAPNLIGNETMNTSQDFKSENNVVAKESGLFGESKSEKNGDERMEKSVNSDGMSEQCSSEVDTAFGLQIGEENHENCSPKPQRVPRVRDKRSPYNQRDNTESLSVVCEDSESIEQKEDFIFSDNVNEFELNNETSTTPRSESSSEVLSIEDHEVSDEVSFADNPASSPVFSESSKDEGFLEEAQADELSKTSICDVDSASQSDRLSQEGITPLSNVSLKDKSESYTQSSICEADTNEFQQGEVHCKEKSTERNITSDLESLNETNSLSSQRVIGKGDTEDRGVLNYHESSGNKSLPTPPPLSSLLASASRTKQKKRPSSNNDHKQPITEDMNSSERNDEIPSEAVKVDEELELSVLNQGVLDGSVTPENEISGKDVSSDAQNLPGGLKQVTSGDSENDMPAGVEFLKTCFPDVDSDLMNALLTANDGDVMKVVDELLASDTGLPASEVTEQQRFRSAVPSFPDTKVSATEHSSFNLSTKKPESFKPGNEMLLNSAAASGNSQQSSAFRENAENPGEMSTKVDHANQLGDLGPTPLAHAQSPGHGTFQLTLEPAVALHLIEMFGHFVGINFQEEISDEDLIVDVDKTLARQLYKKWERSVQTRKGISVSKQGISPQANTGITDSVSRNFVSAQASSPSQRSPRVATGPQAGTLREIMDEQLALELSRNSNVADSSEQHIATKIKRQKLYDMFPGVDPVALEEVFQANCYELIPSVEAVKASCNLSGRQIPSTVVAPGFKSRVPDQDGVARKETEEDWSWLYLDDSSQSKVNEDAFQTLDAPSYLDFRAEAFQHYKQRDECFKKAALAFSKKQGQLAQFYAQQGHLHTQKINEANARAAALILDQKNVLTDENTIDLHGLHVTEAIEALETMLTEKTDPHSTPSRRGCKAVSVITGRGNNSRGGKARIKPAVLEFLKKNNYRYTEPHPGLVKVHL